MKQLYLFLALLACMATYAQKESCCTTTVASVQPEVKNFGRCSGDASCTACSNCSSCKHCSKEGGSCGVCATYTTTKAEKPKKAKSKKQTTVKEVPARPATQPTKSTAVKEAPEPKSPSSYRDREMIEVTGETLNVRQGPGAEYDVVITLGKGDQLTFIKYEGEWLYVYVNGEHKNGWVNFKYVK